MTALPYAPKLEETINEMGQRARDLQARMRTLLWAIVPLGLVGAGIALVNTISHHGLGDAEFVLMGLLALPALGALVWMVVAQGRLLKSFQGLRGSFVPGPSDVRKVASPSAIGPLLEATLAAATITSAWDHSAIDAATALLDALLQSVRPDDKVVLTEDQRNRLQELVLPGRGDFMFKGAGGVGGKTTVALQTLRGNLGPAAVRGLGVLGDLTSVPVLERFARTTRDDTLRQSALHSIEQIRTSQP